MAQLDNVAAFRERIRQFEVKCLVCGYSAHS